MALFQRLLVARKAVAIVILVALTANQWRYFVIFHNYDYISELQYNLPQFRTRYNATINANDQLEHLHDPEFVVVNEIIHRAFFGLGHRLHRSAAAYHLAQSLSLPQKPISSTAVTGPANLGQSQLQPAITHFRFHWESCLESKDIRNSSLLGEDEKEYNVFRYLFGDDLWKLNYQYDSSRASSKYPMVPKDSNSDSNKSRSSNVKVHIRKHMIVLRNDVPGYIAGQLYKDLKLPVTYNKNGTFSRTKERRSLLLTKTISSNKHHGYDAILDKVMRSDVEFYRRLVDNYRFHTELREFQIKHKWKERPLVIGVHLRAGNGEDAHFFESGRASSIDADESVMIARLVRLINMMAIRESKRLSGQTVDPGQQQKDHEQNDVLRPLLFVATDTAHLLPLIDKMIRLGTIKEKNEYDGYSNFNSNETHGPNITIMQPMLVPLEIVTWPQDRLPKNAGVSFDALKGQGERCLKGWKSAVSDALLLSEVDVLIAAKRSTFTQSLPLTLGFDRNRKNNGGDEVNDTSSAATKDNTEKANVTQHSNKMVISNNRRFSFCEVSEPDAAHMTCYMDARTWLFRGEDDRNDPRKKDEGMKKTKKNEKNWSFSIPNTTSSAFDQKQTHQQVEHKVTVLLPDVDLPYEFEQASQFLGRENANETRSMARGTDYESVYRYGQSKINKKYRNSHKVVSKIKSSWNFIYDT